MSREESLDAKDRTTDGGMTREQFIQADAEYDALFLAEADSQLADVMDRAIGDLGLVRDPNYAAAQGDGDGLPYPWCRQPDVCSSKGYCPRDPNCGE